MDLLKIFFSFKSLHVLCLFCIADLTQTNYKFAGLTIYFMTTSLLFCRSYDFNSQVCYMPTKCSFANRCLLWIFGKLIFTKLTHMLISPTIQLSKVKNANLCLSCLQGIREMCLYYLLFNVVIFKRVFTKFFKTTKILHMPLHTYRVLIRFDWKIVGRWGCGSEQAPFNSINSLEIWNTARFWKPHFVFFTWLW